MLWFGFGFNGFGQIYAREETVTEGTTDAHEVKVSCPTLVKKNVNKCTCKHNSTELQQIQASWSRRISLQLKDDSCVFLDGFSGLGAKKCCGFVEQSHRCIDAFNTESHLILAFRDRTEVWDFEKSENSPVWAAIQGHIWKHLASTKLPLVPEGYISLKHLLSSLIPHLQAKSLALGPEHVILLSATGAVYTWGQGSHGQLGHGILTSEEEPRAVEALWGVPVKAVAAGGWHSCCVSATADLYVWGWNEAGQLGLPSRGVKKIQQQSSQDKDESTQTEDKEVFISIQAFPALLDLNPQCEIKAVSSEGSLYTWGWGEYGQLGHQNLISLDEPQCVEYFQKHQLHVTDVVCGAWNTFTAVLKKEEIQKSPYDNKRGLCTAYKEVSLCTLECLEGV
ncbi:hypothetical protein WMY93_031162 [Mugilogobius chulae]|uniref:RCC1 domain-containing protein 1 n=1 Tax=Mugilogobius chulae TaxID=88201 RepID=A0AAW0MES9_9GOBI